MVTKLWSQCARLLFGGAKGEEWWSCHHTSAEWGRTGCVVADEEEEMSMSYQDPTTAGSKHASVHRQAQTITWSFDTADTTDHIGEEKKYGLKITWLSLFH